MFGGQKAVHFVMVQLAPGEYKYALTRPYTYATSIVGHPCYLHTDDHSFVKMSHGGMLTVGQHKTWDGPSGPAVDTVNFMRASLVHDMLYLLIREGQLPAKYRKVADKIMRHIAIEDGMPRWRAWYAWAGVRLGGWMHV